MSAQPQTRKRSALDGGAQRSDRAKHTKPSPGYHKPQSRSFANNGKPPSPFTGKAQSDYKAKPQQSWKGKAAARNEKPKPVFRKKPVTSGGGEEDVDMDEEGGEGADGMDVDDGEYEEVKAESRPLAPGGGGGESEKRPRMTKAERAALHAAQPHRTALLPSAPLLQELSVLWETARKLDLGKEERGQAIQDLWAAVRGRVGEISKGHKGGRILQTIVKYGGREERLGVAMELQPQWRQMMESKYSKFLMAKLIRYLPTIRPLLIKDLAPHLPHLLTHADAVQPLSDFFDLYASAKERRLLVRGLYPKEVMLFEVEGEQGLEGILERTEVKARERVLDGVEKTVLGIFNAAQKAALTQAIYHRLVHEYLTCIYRFHEPEVADTKMRELLAAAAEALPEIVHTKEGSAVVRELLVRGSAKDRKQILQPLRKHVPAMSKDADAQSVLFTAFDCVDDTKLMGKAFVSDITAIASDLIFDKNGRRTLLYLLTPRSTKHFLPASLAALEISAQKARDVGTSKKDPVLRRKELLVYASSGLLAIVQEKGEELVRDPRAGLVVQEIMLHCEGDKAAAIDALVAPLRILYQSPSSADALEFATSHPFDLSYATRTYKTVLSGGHFDSSSKAIKIVDASLPSAFARAVWDALVSEDAGGESNAVGVAQGDAPFVLVEMIEGLRGDERLEAVKGILAGAGVRKQIEATGKKGSSMLVEVLARL